MSTWQELETSVQITSTDRKQSEDCMLFRGLFRPLSLNSLGFLAGSSATHNVWVLPVLTSFMSTWGKLESFRKRYSWWENASMRLACKQDCTSLITDWFERAQPTLSGAVPAKGTWVLWENRLGKLERSKPGSSNHPWPLLQFLPPDSCLESLPWLLWMVDWLQPTSRNELFLPQTAFNHSSRNPNHTPFNLN